MLLKRIKVSCKRDQNLSSHHLISETYKYNESFTTFKKGCNCTNTMKVG